MRLPLRTCLQAAPLSRSLLAQRCPSLRQHLHSSVSCRVDDIENPDVRKLAELAHIDVTDEEVAQWQPQLAQVKGFFEQLRAVDVTDVSPALRAPSGAMPELRADEPEVHPMAESFLDSVPDNMGGLIKVPKIATEADKAA